jgi:hypothetical protein
LANWSRESLTLRETAPGLYQMTATKRWRHLQWRDAEGKLVGYRMIAHGKGEQVWRDADEVTLEEFGATQYSDSKLLELVPADGIDKAELEKLVSDKFAITERTARSYILGGIRQCRRMRDGKSIKCSILKETKRPRKEVYPDQPANRPVSWITRITE